MKKFFALLIVTIIMCFALAGCDNTPGGNDDEGTYYTVTFDSRGGSAVESQRIRKGNTVRNPDAPKRENYSFLGWYKSADDNAVEWKFATDTVSENMTLYAKWQSNGAQTTSDSLTYEQKGTGYVVTGASGQEERIIIPAEHDGLPVTEIGESAFAYSKHTSDITYVSIPDSVTVIGLNAFHNRSELVTVDIGGTSSLASIGRNAFSGNSSLKSIYIPRGVTEIGDSAFNNCGSLENISVATANTIYSGEGNNLIEKATNTLIRGSNKSIIPQSVTSIAQAAFRRANGITELNIPKSVTKIGNSFIADSTIAKINYEGTEADWNAIEKSAKMWNYGNREVQLAFSSAPIVPSEQKVLVVYFSATGTTEKVANYIKAYLNADVFEITPTVRYTSADLNYNDSNSRTSQENRDDTCRPEIVGKVQNIEQYDIIFIGYPIWHGKAPKVVYTFLEQYDFSGKTIIPFSTAASSGIGSSATYLERLTTGATWLDGTRFLSSATKSSVQTWVDEILPKKEI